MLYPLYINKIEDYYFINLAETFALSIIGFYAVYFSLPFLFGFRNKFKSLLLGAVLVIIIAVFNGEKLQW